MKIFLLPLLIAFSIPAEAKTYYFTECGAGKDPACVAGSDTALGTSSTTPYRTMAKFQTLFNAAQPGDQILLAKGGAWDAVAVTLHNTYSGTSAGNLATMAANPVIVDSYTPNWGAGTAKPRLNGPTTGTVNNPDVLMSLGANYSAHDGGFIIRNLDLEAAGGYHASIGIALFRWPTNVAFDNLTINGFGWGGWGCSGQPVFGYPSMITLKNSTITNNGKIGIAAFGCSNLVIDNNTLDNNGFDDQQIANSQDIVRNHPIYISGTDANDGSITTGVVIRNNTLTRNSVCPAAGTNGYNPAHTCTVGKCSATVIVGHDWASDWIVENNTISNADGAAAPGCWGITYAPGNGGYSEASFRFVIRANTIVNPGNTAIQTKACQNCVIENNNVLWTANGVTSAGGAMDCISAGNNAVSASPGTTYQNTNLTIRNNTCYYAKSSDVSHGVSVTSVGTGHVVTNNLIVFDASGQHVAAICVDTTGLPMTAFTAFDNNHCYHYASWTPTQSLAAWRATAGAPDTHSLNTDPLLIGMPSQASPGNTAIGSGSPARGAGHVIYKAPRDRTACARPSPPSIGAYEYFASACGTKPAFSPTQLQ
jgi:hypothetical protein